MATGGFKRGDRSQGAKQPKPGAPPRTRRRLIPANDNLRPRNRRSLRVLLATAIPIILILLALALSLS